MLKDRSVVIVTNGNVFATIILAPLFIINHDKIGRVFIVTGDYKGRRGINSVIRYLSIVPFRYFLYKAFLIRLLPFLMKIFGGKFSSVIDLCRLYNIAHMVVGDVNNDITKDDLSDEKLEFLVSVSCPQLLGAMWLSRFINNGINIHSSLLPRYAGLAPYFWVLAKKENVTGVTVHRLANKFDKGDVLLQENLTIRKSESVTSLFLRLSVLGSQMIMPAIEMLNEKESGDKQDFSHYSYYSNPTTLAMKELKKEGSCLFRSTDFVVFTSVFRAFNNR